MIADAGPAIHLQPIVDFGAGRVAGYEALSRFTCDPPDHWFARAHQVGLGADLEVAALSAALARRQDLEPYQFLTVNASPSALCHPSVQDVLRRAAPLDGLVIELTEHDRLPDHGDLADSFMLVRENGGMIALDDVGSGYAGLDWVLAVRPELVKLDREFVRGIDHDEARVTFVRFVGDLVDGLDTWLVAEGIETEGELETIISLGVPLGQGFHLGRPSPDPTSLDDELRGRIARARAALDRPAWDVAAHLEHAPSFRSGEPTAERAVLVDEFHRPLAVYDRPRLTSPVVAPMRVRPGDEVRVAVLRALARPESERWSPLVLTDDDGRYRGILRMERLVRALTDPGDTP